MRKIRDFKVEWGVKLYKCSSCWEYLPRERYSQNLSWYDFITTECKKCYNIRVKTYRKENKDKRNEYQRNYKAKRRMMLESDYKVVPIHEPHYPQPWPQPIPQPTYPQPEPQPAVILTPSINSWEPVVTTWPIEEWFTFSSDFARAEKMRKDNLAAAEQENEIDDAEIIVQAAIDKNPDAYTEILSDEDLLNAFNNRSVESKVNELTRRQEKFDKQKQEKEYNAMKEKMRDLVDATLDDEQKKHFEDKLHSLHEAQQDDFVRKVSRLSKASFPISREAIFDALLDIQTWKNNSTINL